jgi:gamma-glutamylcyclotransferase (GGCT)/AIG2-like uncharacterized protein YtfP
MKLFVYGSLKPGGWSHYLLGDNVTNPREGFISARLYDCGNFPTIKLDPDFKTKYMVQGLLYDVVEGREETLLQRLDQLEGYPSLFDRTEVTVTTKAKIYDKGTVYFGNREDMFNTPVEGQIGVWKNESS